MHIKLEFFKTEFINTSKESQRCDATRNNYGI